jgi:hypothetical protein
MNFDVFISHSSKDKQAADATCAALEAAGIRCWIAPRDVRPGNDYAAEIVGAINACRLMVVIVSSSSNQSRQVPREVEQAVRKGVPIIPMRIEDVDLNLSMGYFLDSIHWLDAITPPLAKHLEVLVGDVKGLLQVDPASTNTIQGLIGVTAKSRLNGLFASVPPTRWFVAGGVLALALLAAGAMAMFGWPGFRRAPPQTLDQQILLNILRASYDEPLEFPSTPLSVAMQRTIDLGELNSAILQNYPRELLFWLFAKSFQFQVGPSPMNAIGYEYDLPDDYGCPKGDPKNLCYREWVWIAVLSGLTVESRGMKLSDDNDDTAPTNRSREAVDRFCFKPYLQQQAENQMGTTSAEKIEQTYLPFDLKMISPNSICGMWSDTDVEQQFTKPQPDTFTLTVGPNTLAIAPRPASAVFEFLGSLVRTQRDHPQLSPKAYVPARNDGFDPETQVPPKLLTAYNEPLITVLQNAGTACYVAATYKNTGFCVPDTPAAKGTFGFLRQLIQHRMR